MRTLARVAAILTGTIAVFALAATPALANSGHFINNGGNAIECVDTGLTVECDGKVAGLGGTTFSITVVADGVASVECTNPGGNVAPGQDTSVTVAGSSGPLPTPRHGQYVFTVGTNPPPAPPPTPTCPNVQWSPAITDVAFTTATLTLREDGAISDQVTVTVG